ncbi:MAG: hypothetical protein LBC87_07265 [Fibromonadaceae bacterium]|nr:hypothetical protein [Fibromonadaceae bacterium]
MQITDITFSRLVYTPIRDNLYELAEDLRVTVNMPAGKGYRFRLEKKFVTNLRSGTDLLNPIIPRHGNESRTISYILHDANYTNHYFSKSFSDDLLKAMLTNADSETREQIKREKALPQTDKKYVEFLESQLLGSMKIWAIWKAVCWFGKKAWNEPIVAPYEGNDRRFFMEVIE